MIAIVSPAKSLDFDTPYSGSFTIPRALKNTEQLIEVLRTKKAEDIQSLMSISEKLAELNVSRYHTYSSAHTLDNARPCVLAFQGDVYQGLKAEEFTPEDMDFCQQHLRMLSGLYGLLRPLDLIQPYRLEMGTKLAFDDYKTLYGYWGSQITHMINEDLTSQGDDTLINLASQEYFKSVDKKQLKARVIDVEFKDFKNDKYKIISFYAKKARGLMSRFMITHRICNVEDLKNFDLEGYYFDEENSSESKLAFKRG